ncbi:MAG: mannose-1-phosphate guanylyltransferase/mannose-6-phosphate isomerase [Betaproteobacteria bacterium]|nr:mannose-1-phosphate guanylyltransferase/mannose-6-phosphate isomerase [Betaproteobacteria bacterium]
MSIYPVILSGGSGTRLWPTSRNSYPKQFLPLLQGVSPFQATLERLHGMQDAQSPIIVTNQEHRFLLQDQLKAKHVESYRLYVEPFGRSTAPAAAIVAHNLVREDPEAVMLILPSDHDIPDNGEFRDAVSAGADAALAEYLVVFGIEARGPETGYGYIERGEPLGNFQKCYRVSNFVEKPEREIASRFVSSGRYYWNSGIFLFHAGRFLAELKRLQPELAAACQTAADAVVDDHGFRRIDPALFLHCSPLSIDHAVLEETQAAAVVPAAFRWSDIGSWNALWERASKDADGNAIQGDVHLHAVSDSYIHSTRRLVVGIGLKDIAIIETPDALLVADRGSVQCVGGIVEQLRSQGRPECNAHRQVHRPWGTYENVDSGDRFQVKRITVNPGAMLSLQLHHHRAEHWVVVSGAALVTRGEETLLLAENQSAYIPIGVRHRLENPGKIPLQIIEIQSGAYLAEDDIVRLEDAYHRI